jgi:hypothetical protein
MVTMALSTTSVPAQVAGSATIGVSSEEMKVERQEEDYGQDCVQRQDEKIGSIIGVGGFLGMGKHDVATSAGQLNENQDRLGGREQDALKSIPKFESAK